MESPGDHVRKKPSSSSLAEDILAIRAALDGASASARERTLKTLERLTARLAMAESERDMALGMCYHSIHTFFYYSCSTPTQNYDFLQKQTKFWGTHFFLSYSRIRNYFVL